MMNRSSKRAEAGYSLVELLVGTGVMSLVLAATLAGLGDAIRANDAVLQTTGMNNSLRIAMDLMVRDLLQVGAGLPANHAINIPSGTGSTRVKLPGPRDTAFTTGAADEDLVAIIPGPGRGPSINGVATDMITFMTSDNAFIKEAITAFTNSSVTVHTLTPAKCVSTECGPLNIATKEDRVLPGQLMLIIKGSTTTLVQVTGVNYGTRVISFGTDSLNLNQTCSACIGNLTSLNEETPAVGSGVTMADAAQAMSITRVRMISYYLDTKVPRRPRLIRRINNGDHEVFDNTLGTAVAMDVENLQFTYDLVDGDTNPSNVRFVPADYTAGLDPRTIRKVNVSITGRSRNAGSDGTRTFRNTLTTQVSLRGMAFVDQYMAPPE